MDEAPTAPVWSDRARADDVGVRSGIALAGAYYRDVVGPLVGTRWPGLPHAAARLGSGSDVLGLDDAMSRDHDWGLRLTLLVPAGSVADVDGFLEAQLPRTYAGLPTRFPTSWHPAVGHQVEVAEAHDFVESRTGLDTRTDLTVTDWLGVTGQAMLEVTAGAVFIDTAGTLTELRRRLAWYPDDLWRYLLAADWARLTQELPFVGRTGTRGDETGAAVITARLVDIAMHLGFLLDRSWPPYPKWRGTLFAALPHASTAAPALAAAVTAPGWRGREAALVEALQVLSARQRDLGLPTPTPAIENFWDRPFRSLVSHDGPLRASLTDPDVLALPPEVGSLEQWVGNVAVLTDPTRRRRAAGAVAPPPTDDGTP
ncbi:DUF4037 domain-containing protein [Occultella glacieicola]|uniref:DUF4037 domain-containing protein n=1 Tax=Occultella glacieicola TaxID=2518684 RepID=A0ABY2E0B9_9MICO|nr:DUF4037 domain-containing protein [Occultella glacieicola]TDE90862.1 DUF4037 domain-containing protein [Occultella glacieicola]